MTTAEPTCPVCGTRLAHDYNYGERHFFECPQCGLYGLTRTAATLLPEIIGGNPQKASLLSFTIRNTPRTGPDTPLFDLDSCKKIVETGRLPTPQEQADNLIRWLGANLPGPGQAVRLDFFGHAAILGALSPEGFSFVVDGLLSSRLLKGQILGPGSAEVTLSFSGWERYEQLRQGIPSGRKAFMAMQYRNPALDRIVNEYFRRAVEETGFTLRRLDDEPRAGLIDDRLRVEIQSSRFLIVDLTNQNAGAYWEAGYAEGLGKPVIYTCEQSRFKEDSHFDTNHHLHVLWSAETPDAAANDLKATIRATIPEASRE